MSKRAPTTLAGQAFQALAELPGENIREWCVASLDDAASCLLDEWQEKVIAIVGISLTPDNKGIHDTQLLLQGRMYDNSPKKISATKFWKGLPAGHHILLRNVDCTLFNFNEGMVSDLISHDQFDYEFRAKNGDLIEPAELEAAGIRGFCLKAFVWPTASCWASINVILFPHDEPDLTRSYPLAKDDRCPGILFFGEKIPFGPPARLRWGAPFNPAILPGGPVDDFQDFPPAKELSRAMALLLRKAKQPNLKLNVSQLEKAFAHQAENSHNVSTLSPNPIEILWPLPSGDNSGWCNF